MTNRPNNKLQRDLQQAVGPWSPDGNVFIDGSRLHMIVATALTTTSNVGHDSVSKYNFQILCPITMSPIWTKLFEKVSKYSILLTTDHKVP